MISAIVSHPEWKVILYIIQDRFEIVIGVLNTELNSRRSQALVVVAGHILGNQIIVCVNVCQIFTSPSDNLEALSEQIRQNEFCKALLIWTSLKGLWEAGMQELDIDIVDISMARSGVNTSILLQGGLT